MKNASVDSSRQVAAESWKTFHVAQESPAQNAARRPCERETRSISRRTVASPIAWDGSRAATSLKPIAENASASIQKTSGGFLARSAPFNVNRVGSPRATISRPVSA